MSLLSDIKFFLKKYLKNPVLVSAGAYFLYKYLTKYLKKENLTEKIRIVEDIEDKDYSIIEDMDTGKFVLLKGINVWSADSLEELRDFAEKNNL